MLRSFAGAPVLRRPATAVAVAQGPALPMYKRPLASRLLGRLSKQPLAAEINPLFDASFYRSSYSLELEANDLYLHYCYIGRFRGLDPNEFFSTSWYLAQNADVRKSAVDPLDHYLERGAIEGRDPCPTFSSWVYWLLNPDVKDAGVNPLLHYLRHGRHEGRIAATLDSLRRTNGAPTLEAPALVLDDGVPPEPRPGARFDAARPSRQRTRRATAKPLPDDPAAMLVMARRSPIRIRSFAKLFAWHLVWSFHGVRLFGSLPNPIEGPLVVLTNHASWWDAELYHWLAVTAFPDRRGFAPMEANNLARHPSLTRLGAFPTWPGAGFKGASAFLRTSLRLLEEPDTALFIAAEGRFRDVRARPVSIMPGLALLAQRAPAATFIPLAMDYVFWKDRRPNLLLRFGQPMGRDTFEGASVGQIAALMSEGLQSTMSILADAGMSRQPLRFTTLLGQAPSSRS